MIHARPRSYVRGVEERLAIRRARLRLEAGVSRRSYFDAVAPWHQKYVELMEVAQVRHRYELGDAQPALSEAITDAQRVANFWLEGNRLKGRASENPKPHTESGWIWDRLPLRVDVIEFRFGVAAILSLLEYDEMSASILKVVPRMSDWTPAEEGFNYLNFPDAGLVEILLKGRRPAKWQAMLDFGTEFYGRSLLHDSMECYAKIILKSRRADWGGALRAVERAHQLYDQRAADIEFDEFESWEGTGAGNALSIDLRLSALMRHCFHDRAELLDPFKSIHRWKR